MVTSRSALGGSSDLGVSTDMYFDSLQARLKWALNPRRAKNVGRARSIS